MHFDAAHSFLAQMRGSKRIVFFPPSALPALAAYPADHPLHRRSRVNLYAPDDERDEDFPRFAAEAAPVSQTVHLGEGDVVIFPEHWFHHIETTSALSVSVGCRYV
jgi:hypoxia-inducible factor 1-alpha inhibitor (HIF hydroxylase)